MSDILESILTADTHAFGILVRMADMKKAQWPSKREHFEERARNIEEQNPGVKAWVREL